MILGFKGQRIVSSGDLPALVDQSLPGDKVDIEVWRNGKRETITATLGDANEKGAKLAKAGGDADGDHAKLGLALRPLQPEERRQLGTRDGLLIQEVGEGSAAARAGVRPGDVLLAVNGTPVQSVEQVRGAVKGAEKLVALLVQRGADKIFVPVRIG